MNGLIIVSGPSGVGKSTILKRIFQKHPEKFAFSVSCTSREPRKGEQDGIDYFFITREAFEQKITAGAFLEWARVHDNYYGTTLACVKGIIDQGKICILDVDVQGALQIMQSVTDIPFTSIFIAPPDIQSLRSRLNYRSTDAPEIIEKRIKTAEKELAEKEKYDYIVINDNLENAFTSFEHIVLSYMEA